MGGLGHMGDDSWSFNSAALQGGWNQTEDVTWNLPSTISCLGCKTSLPFLTAIAAAKMQICSCTKEKKLLRKWKRNRQRGSRAALLVLQLRGCSLPSPPTYYFLQNPTSVLPYQRLGWWLFLIPLHFHVLFWKAEIFTFFYIDYNFIVSKWFSPTMYLTPGDSAAFTELL